MTTSHDTARFRVIFAGPHVSYQDGGRPGKLRFGVPRSGPMDRLAHGAANTALGNDATRTVIEVSRGSLVLECTHGAATFAIAGGQTWTGTSIAAGDRLTVTPGEHGSWSYLAVLGEFVAPVWLGQTATHSMSGFGGGTLSTGDEIEVANPRTDPQREGEIPMPDFDSQASVAPGEFRVVLGPQDHHFEAAAVETFLTSSYELTTAYDRMGVRLAGPPLRPQGALSIPSEPIVLGSVQVGGDAVPTVLLADHQTTGGYPKIATVISADLNRFVQHRTGDAVRFRAVDAIEAVHLARSYGDEVAEYLQRIAKPGRTLAHRLMRENLITASPFESASGDPES